jgi:hypothetical protein
VVLEAILVNGTVVMAMVIASNTDLIVEVLPSQSASCILCGQTPIASWYFMGMATLRVEAKGILPA